MPLVVEDGTGLLNAESYGPVSEADVYLEDTGYAPEWASFSATKKEGLLRAATRTADNSMDFRGNILKDTQALSFPRENLYDREGRLIVGIPLHLRQGIYELAYSMSQNNYLTDSETSSLDSVRVGPIALELSSSAKITKTLPDMVIRLLGEYGRYRWGKVRMRPLSVG